jgi:hypothetical protein
VEWSGGCTVRVVALNTRNKPAAGSRTRSSMRAVVPSRRRRLGYAAQRS